MGLQDELNTMLATSMTMIPKETAAIMAGSMQDLEKADITEKSLRQGDTAPEFEFSGELGLFSYRRKEWNLSYCCSYPNQQTHLLCTTATCNTPISTM